MKTLATITLCIACAAAQAADATPGPYEFRMAPGKSHEICMPLKQGEGIEFSFQTDAPVHFNVHYHVKDKVVLPLELRGISRQTNRVVAKTANTYCMMWTATAQSEAGVLGKWQMLARDAK